MWITQHVHVGLLLITAVVLAREAVLLVHTQVAAVLALAHGLIGEAAHVRPRVPIPLDTTHQLALARTAPVEAMNGLIGEAVAAGLRQIRHLHHLEAQHLRLLLARPARQDPALQDITGCLITAVGVCLTGDHHHPLPQLLLQHQAPQLLQPLLQPILDLQPPQPLLHLTLAQQPHLLPHQLILVLLLNLRPLPHKTSKSLCAS